MRKIPAYIIIMCLSVFSLAALPGCGTRVLVQPELDATKYHRVAILPFETDSFLSNIGQQLSDEIIMNVINQAPNLDVVERSKIDALMQEQSLTQGKYISPESAIQMGRLLGAQAIVTGSVSAAIGDIQPSPLNTQRVATGVATMRFIDTETGKILWAKRETAEYSIFTSTGYNGSQYRTQTDHEMGQEIIQRLGRALAKYFYLHEEVR